MRTLAALVCIPLFLSAAPVARAQEIERPAAPAPAATAPFDQRESWCMDYTAWFVARVPEETSRPSDVRPTQRVENEMNYCKLDPREYERETLAELAEAGRASS